MNKRDLLKFEKLLLEQRAKLDGSIRNMEEAARADESRERGGDFASYAESGTDNFDRETALNIASGESAWLAEVSDALRRIQNGTYGICEGCEEKIPVKRLEVFPSARFCVNCQAEVEKNRSAF